MQVSSSSQRIAQFPVLPLLPPAIRPWASTIEPVLRRFLIPGDVAEHIQDACEAGSGARFAASLLASLGIRYDVADGDLLRIPRAGPVVVVSNHPYGIVEGLILMTVLDRVRADAKILANSIVAAVPEIAANTIPVNPFHSAAHPENHGPLRKAVSWLSAGGLLSIFPAGEVSHSGWPLGSIVDPVWKTTAARLALRAACPVVPIFFEGSNSLRFHLSGVLHPALRTLSLPREFYRLRGATIRLRAGGPIPASVLKNYVDCKQATAYLRARTYFLPAASESPREPAGANALAFREIAPAGPAQRFLEEVRALPSACQMAGNREFVVYLARTPQIPRLVEEIGRCRELAFRSVGEGTGRACDIDTFDDHYHHLFLWNRGDARLAGSYRLAFTADVLPTRGVAGLYTSTLFRFDSQFFDRLGDAVELGRSFVLPDYQRTYSALFLPWKGLLRAVAGRPETKSMFGAVSISRSYLDVSRMAMASYLARRAAHPLGRLVVPRCSFRNSPAGTGSAVRLAESAASLDDLSSAIADIEPDGKGVPVLLRHYLKAGGLLLGLNIDQQFAGVLDALLLLDLQGAPSRVVERCMVGE